MSTPFELPTSALRAILLKAASDADFRAKCLADPAAAVREIAGLELPPEAGVKFVEQAEEGGIVLPPFSADADEITEADLSKVAGAAPYTLSRECGY